MKKLTAGIFATMLMAVAGAANADIASTQYVGTQVGTLSELQTSAQDNTVAAINELVSSVSDVESSVGDLETTVSDLEGKLSGEGGILGEDGGLADNVVTSDSIADGAVTEDKLGQDLQQKLEGFEVTENKVDADSVSSNLSSDTMYPSVAAAKKIVDDALSSAGLVGEDGIDGGNIKEGTIGSEQIEDGSITKEDLDEELQGEIDGKLDSTTAAETYQAKSTQEYSLGNAEGSWTQLTEAEQNALKSGITAEKVSSYESAVTKVNALPDASGCEGESGCALIYQNGEYKWEAISR